MALIKCPECGRGVSDTATDCPGCASTLGLSPSGAGGKTTSLAWDRWKNWPLVGLIPVMLLALGLIALNMAGLHPSLSQRPVSEAQREAAQGFWDTVVDQYIKLGLIARYQSENGTFVMYVRGRQWRLLSYTDKKIFLANLAKSNEILGKPSRVEIRDEDSKRTYAVKMPPGTDEVYE